MIIQYTHHDALVYVDSELMGKHKEHCLCYKCCYFKPGMANNCSIAQELYQICVKHNLVTPVYECPVFKAK